MDDRVSSGGLSGFLRAEREDRLGNKTILFEEPNLIVNGASLILRDLMLGNSGKITKMHFGDSGLNASSDLVNIAAPAVGDSSLIRKRFEKASISSSGLHGGHPGVRFTTTLDVHEFNGANEKIITEYALATATNAIFTRKTRAAIIKDTESSLTFTWWLVFN